MPSKSPTSLSTWKSGKLTGIVILNRRFFITRPVYKPQATPMITTMPTATNMEAPAGAASADASDELPAPCCWTFNIGNKSAVLGWGGAFGWRWCDFWVVYIMGYASRRISCVCMKLRIYVQSRWTNRTRCKPRKPQDNPTTNMEHCPCWPQDIPIDL